MARGKGQIVMTHVVTGLLHCAMELKTAYMDNIPLLLIVGQNKTHNNEIFGGSPGPHYLSFTEIGGQQRLVQPYVKWSETPETNANIIPIMERAYNIANTDVKGPVLLSISRELLFQKDEKMRTTINNPPPSKVGADQETTKKLAKLLAKAEDALIFSRYLGRNQESVHNLEKLAELLGIPVFETPGYTNFPTNNLLHLGNNIMPYVEKMDVLLVIDSSGWPPWYPPGIIRDKTKAKIVFIDLDPLQLKYPVYDYPADMVLRADSQTLIPQLTAHLENTNLDTERIEERRKNWTQEHLLIRRNNEETALKVKDEYPIHPIWLCYCINKAIDENTIVIHETISHGRLIHQYIEKNRTKPGTRYESTGPVAHTGLGQGLGIALGVKMVEPEKNVIALEGDGSFNYNPISACFGASQEYGLPFLSIIFDNQGYIAMKQHERFYPQGTSAKKRLFYGVPCEPKPDYVKMAEAFGGYAELIDEPSMIFQGLKNAISEIEKGRLALLDVILGK
jgi:acetolactate synthase-1/2/3 large subunit